MGWLSLASDFEPLARWRRESCKPAPISGCTLA